MKNFKNNKTHVLMPFSPSIKKQGFTNWSLITKVLGVEFENLDDLDKSIKAYCTNLHPYKFDVIHSLAQNRNKFELISLLNQIKGLALNLPKYLTQPIPLLVQGENATIFMSQMQIAAILANAFLCTFPFRTHRNNEYKLFPIFNFAK